MKKAIDGSLQAYYRHKLGYPRKAERYTNGANEQKMTECICACVYMFLRACKRRYKKTRDANLQARAKLVRWDVDTFVSKVSLCIKNEFRACKLARGATPFADSSREADRGRGEGQTWGGGTARSLATSLESSSVESRNSVSNRAIIAS